MKIFIAKNSSSDSDFTDKNYMQASHSCGYVIAAESKDEALKMAGEQERQFDNYTDEEIVFDLEEVILDKPGIILYANGSC